MNDLISVLVPVYNVEKYLANCLDSILRQTYENFELILVDDGSNDNSGKICDHYKEIDSRVKVIHTDNKGVSNARNVAFKESKGNWIAFIDSDDWVESTYLEELLNTAIKYNTEIVLCGYYRAVNNNTKQKVNGSGGIKIMDSKKYLIKILNPQTGYGFCHMKIYKRHVINEVLFDTDLKVGEDALYNEQVAHNINTACLLEKCLYYYRINPNSVVRKFDKNYANKYLDAMNKNKLYLIKHYKNDNEVKQGYYNFVAFHVMLIAVNYCYNSNNIEKNKRKLLKEICCLECFEQGIDKSNYKNLSLTRQITLFTLKHKFYFFTELICKYRQRQTEKSKKSYEDLEFVGED